MDYIVLKGAQIVKYLEEVVKFRLKVFREYPYLYDGNLDYEKEYFKDFANNPRAMVILVTRGEKTVGVATSIALA